MKITLATLGSRGDLQPFLALAVALHKRGHEVRLAANEPFRAAVEAELIEFRPIGGDIKEIVGDAGRAALLAADRRPLASLRALRDYVGPLVREGLDRMSDALAGSDVIMGQLLAPGAAAYAERHQIPYFEMGYDPIVPTWDFAHPGGPPDVPQGALSRLTFFAAEQVFWQAFRPDVNRYREALGLNKAPFLGPSATPVHKRPPTLLGYSEVIVPRPRDWPDHVMVTGAWMLDCPRGYKPDPALFDFITSGPAPVYIGFGSMTVPHPEAMARSLVRAVRKAKQRAVLSTGWGGLSELEGSDDVMFVGDVPHSWLFPKMAAVVHHGGPGTTAEGLRAGIPQLVVPFLSDQPFWGHHVARAGVGPKMIPIGEISADKVAAALTAMSDPAMRARAEAVGAKVRAEPGADGAARAMEQYLERRGRAGGRTRVDQTPWSLVHPMT